VFTPFEDFEQEELWVLMLNTKNRITHDSLVYRGQIDTIVVRMAEVFRPAVRVNARTIIVSHCHPSGDPTPSPEDVRVTEDIRQAGQLLGIELLDHLVIGMDKWVSLKERGLGFT
jgi:DNA repair protein RadC